MIVTDRHVVAGSNQVTVAFANGQRVGGQVVGSDAPTDLAVVKANRAGLPAATFAKSLPAVGSLAIAIGSPLGLANTVSAGIISALGRTLPGTPGQSPTLLNEVQTDAAISPGDSGGALADAQGQVVGINEAILPPSTGAVLIGFANPATAVNQIVPQLIKNGSVQHPFLGAQLTDLTPSVAQQLGVSVSQGAVVMDVAAGGPAAAAGMQAGDIVTAIGSTPVQAADDVVIAVRSRNPGDTLTLAIARGNATRTLNVILSDHSG
jgi:S1-C subfamily serine protease